MPTPRGFQCLQYHVGRKESRHTRQRQVEEFMENHDVCLLNDGSPARISFNSESAINLSLCSSRLAADLHWSALSSPGGSDRCLILISCPSSTFETANRTTRWNFKQARWNLYKNSRIWYNLSNIVAENETLLNNLQQRILLASTESIPKLSSSKYYLKPWWSEKLRLSKQQREISYQRYRRQKTFPNLLLWKRHRAEHKKSVRKHQRRSWILFVERMNIEAPMSRLYENIRRIRGKEKRKISILREGTNIDSTIPKIANKLAQSFRDVSSDNNYSVPFPDV